MTADISMSGWREGTKKCYHSYMKWIKHGDERSKDPFRPTADELIVFLTSLYNQGKRYSCINLARSAVATLSLGSKISVGMHPLVKKFVRGVFNRRPAFPRNTVTWDADIVFEFLKKWSPAANLFLLQLTLKVVLLCLLVSGQRGQALWLLDLRNITWSKTFDVHLEISSRLPLQTDIRTNLCLEAFLKINPSVWCTTCVIIRKNLCFEGFRDKTVYKLESPSLRCFEGHTTTMD